MKGKKKTTIELTPEEVEAIIKAYFVKKKNVVIQEVDFNINVDYEDHNDVVGTHVFNGAICTREDEIEI